MKGTWRVYVIFSVVALGFSVHWVSVNAIAMHRFSFWVLWAQRFHKLQKYALCDLSPCIRCSAYLLSSYYDILITWISIDQRNSLSYWCMYLGVFFNRYSQPEVNFGAKHLDCNCFSVIHEIVEYETPRLGKYKFPGNQTKNDTKSLYLSPTSCNQCQRSCRDSGRISSFVVL